VTPCQKPNKHLMDKEAQAVNRRKEGLTVKAEGPFALKACEPIDWQPVL